MLPGRAWWCCRLDSEEGQCPEAPGLRADAASLSGLRGHVLNGTLRKSWVCPLSEPSLGLNDLSVRKQDGGRGHIRAGGGLLSCSPFLGASRGQCMGDVPHAHRGSPSKARLGGCTPCHQLPAGFLSALSILGTPYICLTEARLAVNSLL